MLQHDRGAGAPATVRSWSSWTSWVEDAMACHTASPCITEGRGTCLHYPGAASQLLRMVTFRNTKGHMCLNVEEVVQE